MENVRVRANFSFATNAVHPAIHMSEGEERVLSGAPLQAALSAGAVVVQNAAQTFAAPQAPTDGTSEEVPEFAPAKKKKG